MKLRSAVKWGSCGATLVFVGCAAVSLRFCVCLDHPIVFITGSALTRGLFADGVDFQEIRGSVLELRDASLVVTSEQDGWPAWASLSAHAKARKGTVAWTFQSALDVTGTRRERVIPLWPAAAAASIPAIVILRGDRRRIKDGLCGRCGYSRAGLAPDAKCPECGAMPAK